MTATGKVSAWNPTSSGHGGQEMGDHAWVESERVLGVDACKAGWVGLALTGLYCGANVAGTIDELVEMADADGPLAVVAVDIPIGLPNRGRRQADVLARKAVGTLTSSVFMTPTRAALDAPDHRTASARNHALTEGDLPSSIQPQAQAAPGGAVGSPDPPSRRRSAPRGQLRRVSRRSAHRKQEHLGRCRVSPTVARRRGRAACRGSGRGRSPGGG